MENMEKLDVIFEEMKEEEANGVVLENLEKKKRHLGRRKDTAKKNLNKKEKLKNSSRGSNKRNFVKKTSSKNFRRGSDVVGCSRGLHRKLSNKREHNV